MEESNSRGLKVNTGDEVVNIDASSVEVTDWKAKKEEIERRKEDVRTRIHDKVENYEQAKEYFIPARPAPSIDDEEFKRVAVYARVSTSSADQISSIENQTIYYKKKIEESPNWELQEIYSDEGKSGTSMRHRDEFKRMMENAKEKKMDLIVCASVSRFARNVSDCLEQVAQLKTMNPSHPVGVFFEKEYI